MAGVSVGRWFAATQNFPPQSVAFYLYPPSKLVYGAPKVVVGVGALLLWRAAVKATLPGPAQRIFGSNGSTTGTASLKSIEVEEKVASDPNLVTSPSEHLTTARKRKPSGKGDSASPRSETTASNEVAWSTPFRFSTSEGTLLCPLYCMSTVSKHLNHSVVVKIVVYFGIGWLGSEMLPFLFGELGWA